MSPPGLSRAPGPASRAGAGVSEGERVSSPYWDTTAAAGSGAGAAGGAAGGGGGDGDGGGPSRIRPAPGRGLPGSEGPADGG